MAIELFTCSFSCIFSIRDLMAGREIKRSFTESQGDPRRASEVTGGKSTESVVALQRLRQQRIASEKQRLDGFYPIIKDA